MTEDIKEDTIITPDEANVLGFNRLQIAKMKDLDLFGVPLGEISKNYALSYEEDLSSGLPIRPLIDASLITLKAIRIGYNAYDKIDTVITATTGYRYLYNIHGELRCIVDAKSLDGKLTIDSAVTLSLSPALLGLVTSDNESGLKA